MALLFAIYIACRAIYHKKLIVFIINILTILLLSQKNDTCSGKYC
jgi:hypothetical protein